MGERTTWLPGKIKKDAYYQLGRDLARDPLSAPRRSQQPKVPPFQPAQDWPRHVAHVALVR